MVPQAEKKKKKYQLPFKALAAYKTDLIEISGRQKEDHRQKETERKVDSGEQENSHSFAPSELDTFLTSRQLQLPETAVTLARTFELEMKRTALQLSEYRPPLKKFN